MAEGREQGRRGAEIFRTRRILASTVARRFPALADSLAGLDQVHDVAAMDKAFRGLIVADEHAARTILAELPPNG